MSTYADAVTAGAVTDWMLEHPAKPMPQVKRAALRYHGGKFILAPWIIGHFPPHRVYVEPFGGAASVLLQKPRIYSEVYNDLDGEVVNLFRVARDRPRELRRSLALTPFSRADYIRALDESPTDPLEVARLMVVRCFMGFGSNANNRKVRSGFRANANRNGTTPAHDWANLPSAFRAITRRLAGVVIENKPAIDIIAQHDSSKTLFYCDPPYVHAARAMSKMHGDNGYTHEMTDDDHRQLAQVLRNVRGMVVLSGYHSALYDDLYGDWRRVKRKTFGDGACERTEIIWFNPAANTALDNASLFRRESA